MDEEAEGVAEQYELPVGVGEKLRLAREAKGLSLAQVAAETRITQRHLALIEAGDFAALPGRTYAVGFSRTYAKLIGLDEAAIAEEVRAELNALGPRDTRAATFEPGDPARVPSVRLAWFSALAGLLMLIGVGAFVYTSFFAGDGEVPWLTGDSKPAPKPTATASAPVTNGVVVFTALEQGVWVKFTDAEGRQLMQGEMLEGESYTVPSDVTGPLLSTARPTALAITVGGKPVAPLAATDIILQNVPVAAAELLARPPSGAAPTPAASAPRGSGARSAAPAAQPTPETTAAAPPEPVPPASPTE